MRAGGHPQPDAAHGIHRSLDDLMGEMNNAGTWLHGASEHNALTVILFG